MLKFAKTDLKNSPAVMGIINLTPDSSSDGGQFFSAKKSTADNVKSMASNAKNTACDAKNTAEIDVNLVVEAAKKMLADGADILDLGAESTRPNFTAVSANDEIARLIPALKAVKTATNAFVSVDTYKPKTARIALENGADMLNVVFPSEAILKVAAEFGCPICLMSHTDLSKLADGEFEVALLDDLKRLVDLAILLGVDSENIILDGGVGFGKTDAQNLKIISGAVDVKSLGYPVLLGFSKKRVVKNLIAASGQLFSDALPFCKTCDTTSNFATHKASNILSVATANMATIAAYNNSFDILRVHDVKENINAVAVAKALKN